MKLFFLIFLYSNNIFANELTRYQFENFSYQYQKPGAMDFITSAPKNYSSFLKTSFSKDSLSGWGIIIASSSVLFVLDEKILTLIQKSGRKMGFGNDDKSRRTLKIGDEYLMYAPTDFPSAILFLGDGWTSIGLGTGFLAGGLYLDDSRALSTSSQLFQGLLMTGLSTQILKRINGRETPHTKSKDRGRWRPFPETEDYNNFKSKYDSFPSAHITTAMTSFTIISKNYADYQFINPLGYTLLGLLGYQLINSGSHWASDFPLSIGLGYLIGKTIVDKSRTVDKKENQISVTPFLKTEGQIGATVDIYI